MPSVDVTRFGGLNLVADPQELGMEQASSLLNVSLDRNGRARTRDGFSTSYTSAVTAFPTAIYPVSGTTVLVAIQANSVKWVDLNTGTSSETASLTAAYSSFASAGSTEIYFTDTTHSQVRKFTEGAAPGLRFTSPAGLAAYEGNFLAVQPLDDRLVIADANSTSKLWFSDPDTPETIDVANFIELTPGDGEPITGMRVFGTSLFVFKKTKFFVFYGNSTDSTGGVVFNYRMVDTGVGCVGATRSLTAVHETGVYFVGTDGVYRTTGGEPVKVSGALDPMFEGMNLPIPAPFSSVLTGPLTVRFDLVIASDKLYLFGQTGLLGGEGTWQFVMDIRTGDWTVYDLEAATMLDGDLSSYPGESILGAVDGTGKAILARMSSSETADAGTAISWHHQSGFYDLGSPNSKRVGPVDVWGTGTVTVSMFADHGSTDTNAAAVTLGVDPAVVRGRHSKTYRGRVLSHRLSGSGPAVVYKATVGLRDQRVQ